MSKRKQDDVAPPLLEQPPPKRSKIQHPIYTFSNDVLVRIFQYVLTTSFDKNVALVCKQFAKLFFKVPDCWNFVQWHASKLQPDIPNACVRLLRYHSTRIVGYSHLLQVWDANLNTVRYSANTLHRIDFAETNIVFDHILCPNVTKLGICPMMQQFNFAMFPKLCSLVLHHRATSDYFASCTNKMQIQSLTIKDIITDDELKAILLQFPNLATLKLLGVESITVPMPNLTYLKVMDYSPEFTYKFAPNLVHFKLRIVSDDRIDFAGLMGHSQLRHVTMENQCVVESGVIDGIILPDQVTRLALHWDSYNQEVLLYKNLTHLTLSGLLSTHEYNGIVEYVSNSANMKMVHLSVRFLNIQNDITIIYPPEFVTVSVKESNATWRATCIAQLICKRKEMETMNLKVDSFYSVEQQRVMLQALALVVLQKNFVQVPLVVFDYWKGVCAKQRLEDVQSCIQAHLYNLK